MSKHTKDIQALLNKISQLESINDQVVSEIIYINDLLCAVGFSDGIESLKSAAEELLEDDQD